MRRVEEGCYPAPLKLPTCNEHELSLGSHALEDRQTRAWAYLDDLSGSALTPKPLLECHAPSHLHNTQRGYAPMGMDPISKARSITHVHSATPLPQWPCIWSAFIPCNRYPDWQLYPSFCFNRWNWCSAICLEDHEDLLILGPWSQIQIWILMANSFISGWTEYQLKQFHSFGGLFTFRSQYEWTKRMMGLVRGVKVIIWVFWSRVWGRETWWRQ